uniref:C3H1-type domain-containing protein n=1 Tax=Meloidogyne javanica TaxID=6303 RepID=A0A915M5U2_MELJA
MGDINGENGEDKGSNRKDNGKDRDVCRDYLNNICNRGSRCKFYHPEEHDNKAQNAADEPYQFCIDFQNQGCSRDNCRYVHAFREDVERYKRTGDVTLGLARALAALMRGDTINSIPLCKEFQNGHCARGPQCRYWHINKDEERRKRFHGRHVGAASPFGAYTGHTAGIRRRADDYGSSYDDYMPPEKRIAPFVQPLPVPMIPGGPTRLMVDLERRNAELIAEVDSLKRELQREKERYDDLMSLFRATQANQTASIQTRPSGASQPGIPSMGGQQQQPGAMQQWGTGGGGKATPNYMGSFDWTAN